MKTNMKYLLIVSCLLLLGFSNLNHGNKLISEVIFNTKRDTMFVQFSDNKLSNIIKADTFSLKMCEGFKYLLYNSDTFYFNPEKNANLNDLLCSRIIDSVKEKESTYNFNHAPFVSLIFFVDKQGEIIEKGFVLKDIESFYNAKTIIELDNMDNSKMFTPAYIDNRAVGSIYSILIKFSTYKCTTQDLT